MSFLLYSNFTCETCGMATSNLISTAETAAMLRVTPQAIRARVKAGTLEPVEQVGRAYVFDRAVIESLCVEGDAA